MRYEAWVLGWLHGVAAQCLWQCGRRVSLPPKKIYCYLGSMLAKFFKIPCEKVLQNLFFFGALVPRSSFRPAISDAVARGPSLLSNSVSADRPVMAASRLLGAAAACVILVSLQLDIVNRIGVAASRLRQCFVSRFPQLWRAPVFELLVHVKASVCKSFRV